MKLAEGWVSVVKPVLDHLSVTNTQIDVVEVVAMHLSRPSCVFPSFSRLPSTNSSSPSNVVQPTCNAHVMSIVVRPPCPTSSFAVLCARQRRLAPPAPHCRRDSLGCITTPALQLFCTVPALAARTRAKCCTSTAASCSGWSSGCIPSSNSRLVSGGEQI